MDPEFRLVGPEEEAILAEIFRDIDETFFRPHPFTADEAASIARQTGRDTYALLFEDGRAVAYGMLRGWDEGYSVPSLGIAVRTTAQGRGLGRAMMEHLHAEAGRRGATVVRLRVHPGNVRARRMYESMGYAYAGVDRGELVMIVALEHGDGASLAAGSIAPTMTGALLDPDALEWKDLLLTSRHDFYHMPAYVALCAANERGRPCALLVRDASRAMLLPFLIREIPGGGFDAASPYGYPGPIGPGTEDPAFLRVALIAGMQVLHDEGVVSSFIRLHPILNAAPPEGVGTLVHNGDTVSIDLDLPVEELWAQTRHGHRGDITRAARMGYVARMDEGWRHLDTFRNLYRQTMERRSATPFYFFGEEYFEGLRAALGQHLHLCVVERAGRGRGSWTLRRDQRHCPVPPLRNRPGVPGRSVN